MKTLEENNTRYLLQKGNAMTEYAVVLVFMSLVFYLAVVDGISYESIDENGIAVTEEIPALTQALSDQEENFINALTLP